MKQTQYLLYRRLGGHHGPFGQIQNISPPMGFETLDHPGHSYSGPPILFHMYINIGCTKILREQNKKIKINRTCNGHSEKL